MMKSFTSHIKMLAVVLAMTLAGVMSAQAQELKDADYNTMARLSANGTLRSATRYTMGYFETDGSIADSKHNALGSIKQGEIFDTAGERIGYINRDGTVRNAESIILGKIGTDGRVTDATYTLIGYAKGVRLEWAACYYFFDFFKPKVKIAPANKR